MNCKQNWKKNDLGLKLSETPYKKASYITDGGEFINLEENRINIFGHGITREIVHKDFQGFLIRKGIEKLYKDLNLIRINDGTYLEYNECAYIELNSENPSELQYEALLKWLDMMSLKSKKHYMCVGFDKRCPQYYEFINAKNKDGLLPEEIIKEIRKMYETIN